MAEIDEIKDLAATLNTLIQRLSDAGTTIAEGFTQSASSAAGLHNVLEQLLIDNDDIAKGIKTADDFQRKLTTDAKFFAKAQGAIAATQEKIIGHLQKEAVEQMYEKLALVEDEVEQARIIGETMGSIYSTEQKLTEEMKRQLQLLERQSQTSGDFFGNIKKFMNEFDKAPGIFGKLKVVKDTLGAKGGLVTVALGLGAIALIKGVQLAWDLLKASFMATFNFMDKKVIPSNAALNKELGNTGQAMKGLKQQAVSTGVQFEYLGLDFQTGAEAVKGLAASMMTLDFPKETLKTGLLLSEYVGLGAEKAGKLLVAFQKTGVSIEDVNKAMKGAVDLQKEYGVPAQQIRKDIGDNIDLLARFGTANVMEMSKSAAKVRQYGLTIKEVGAAFGKTMDTFDKTSDSSAKLNAVFGTNINSFELMMETNPEKRMALVRKELDKQKISWEKLHPFEKNVLTTTLGLTEEQAQLAFASKKTRDELERQMREKQRLVRVDQDWNKGLGNIKNALLVLQPRLDMLLRNVADIVSKLMGFKSGGEAVADTSKVIESFLDNLNNYLEKDFFKSPGGKLLAKFFGIPLPHNVDDLGGELAKADRAIKSHLKQYTHGMGQQSPQEMERLTALAQERGAQDAGFADYKDLLLNQEKLSKHITRESEKSPVYVGEQNWVATNDKMDKYFKSLDAGTKGKVTPREMVPQVPAEIMNFGHEDALSVKDREELNRAVSGPTASKNPNAASDVRVEFVDINMDGKKVGEAQLRISRT